MLNVEALEVERERARRLSMPALDAASDPAASRQRSQTPPSPPACVSRARARLSHFGLVCEALNPRAWRVEIVVFLVYASWSFGNTRQVSGGARSSRRVSTRLLVSRRPICIAASARRTTIKVRIARGSSISKSSKAFSVMSPSGRFTTRPLFFCRRWSSTR